MSGSNWRYRHAKEAVSEFVALRNTFRVQMEHAADPEFRRKNPYLRQDTFSRLDHILEWDHRIENPQQRKDVMTMFKGGDYSLVLTWPGQQVETF